MGEQDAHDQRDRAEACEETPPMVKRTRGIHVRSVYSFVTPCQCGCRRKFAGANFLSLSLAAVLLEYSPRRNLR